MKKVLSLLLCVLMVMSFVVSTSAITTVKVKSITLDKSSLELKVGQTYNLKVAFTPANTNQKVMKYSTSNQKIAKVDANGKITAVSAGKVAIIATNTLNNKVSAKCNVTILPVIKVKPIEFSVFVGDPQGQPTKDNKIYKLIKEKLGVTFKFEFLVGDLDQKLGVMIASGDYPDIISGSNSTQKLIDGNALIPLQNLIAKEAPNLQKHYAPIMNKMKSPKDSNVYVMVNYGRIYNKFVGTYYSGPAFWIQKAVLKEFGYPKIKTLDEYFSFIQKYKEKYPQIDGKPTIGFDALSFDWRSFCLKNPPEHLSGHPNDGDVVVDNGVASIFADKDYAKRYYKKINDMNNLGLVDQETFVMNYDQYLAKLSSGRVLGMFDQHWNFQQAEDSLVTQNKIERTYVPLPLTFDRNSKDYYLDRPLPNIDRGFGISTKCKDPVRAIKLFDTLVTEDWQKILNWGIEGQDYQVDAKGRFTRTEQQRKNAQDPTWMLANKAKGIFENAAKMEGLFSDGNACSAGDQPEEFLAGLKPLDKELLTAYGHKSWFDFFSTAPENRVDYPAWQIPLGDGTSAAVANSKISETSLKYLPQVILANPADFNKTWDSYVQALHKIDIKAYENKINEQIKWRQEHWSSGK